jgi:hypothetical protein
MTESELVLEGEKALRDAIKTALKAIYVSEDCAAADLLACQTFVATLDKKRANAIAANKPNDVIDIDGKSVRARVAAEIAAAKWKALTKDREAAVGELIRAKTAVREAAKAVMLDEVIGLAREVTAYLDAALVPGQRLQALASRNFLNTPLNAALPSVPVEVTQALSRLPPLDLLHTPINVLRNGGSSNAWTERLAELIADDESIFDVAADHKPRDGVGSLSRAADFS